jgi:hypothetical protein
VAGLGNTPTYTHPSVNRVVFFFQQRDIRTDALTQNGRVRQRKGGIIGFRIYNHESERERKIRNLAIAKKKRPSIIQTVRKLLTSGRGKAYTFKSASTHSAWL